MNVIVCKLIMMSSFIINIFGAAPAQISVASKRTGVAFIEVSYPVKAVYQTNWEIPICRLKEMLLDSMQKDLASHFPDIAASSLILKQGGQELPSDALLSDFEHLLGRSFEINANSAEATSK